MSAFKKINFEITDIKNESKAQHDTSDRLASYFNKIENYDELFRIGKGLLQEVQKGTKSFAFSSLNLKSSQQKTILGLCCYFNQNYSGKVLIISDQLSSGIFNDIYESSTLNSYVSENGEDFIKYKSFYHHFDLLNFEELGNFYEKHLKKFDDELKNILNKYDVILWDIPEMSSIQKKFQFYYRISNFYESMTVIVSKTGSSGKQLESLRNFFSNYNIELHGVLFDNSTDKENIKRKKLLGIF